ncbi:ABC transporter permease subunit, partial [Escherichia coli]|uniref:ABC transporter permease subunit n=1 Tax=Escherichia coli TaxID=562 RepID=UPI003F7AA30F
VHGVPRPSWLQGSIALGDVMTYPVYRLFISAVGIAVALLLYWVIARTRLGMMLRAGAINREMTGSLGIDVNKLYRLVFAAGVALAAAIKLAPEYRGKKVAVVLCGKNIVL